MLVEWWFTTIESTTSPAKTNTQVDSGGLIPLQERLRNWPYKTKACLENTMMILIGMGSGSLKQISCRPTPCVLEKLSQSVSLSLYRYKDTPPINGESLQPTKKRHVWALKTIYESKNIYIYCIYVMCILYNVYFPIETLGTLANLQGQFHWEKHPTVFWWSRRKSCPFHLFQNNWDMSPHKKGSQGKPASWNTLPFTMFYNKTRNSAPLPWQDVSKTWEIPDMCDG